MFNKESAEAVLMVDTSNDFNKTNKETFHPNKNILFPLISTYISNCYWSPTDLCIQGWSIKSEEETTQGHPRAMAM